MPTADDIRFYLKNDTFPKCPQEGTYIIGRVDEDPRCSIGISAWPNVHVLPEDRDDTNNWWWINFKMAYSILFGMRPAPPTP